MLGNATSAAKVGFFLEQHREELMVEEEHLEPLKARRPRQPHYMVPNRRKAARLVKEWNLVVPMQIIERSWAEVL
jgi:hypothetical protein